MKIITLTTALAMLAAPVFAENYQPPKELQPPTSCCDIPAPPVVTERADKTDLLLPLLVILGIAIAASQAGQPDHDAPRPTVEPEPDYNKILEQVGQ